MRQIVVVFALVFLAACKKGGSGGGGNPPPPPAAFAKGADISWLTQMESQNIKFYNSAGTEQDLIQILKNLGMNTIRLRAWVDPAGGWNGTNDLVAKAVRAKNLGMRILLNFHYSDSWADPGQQFKPAAWAALDFNALKTAMANYTVSVMNALKTAGVTPEWVQIGNETNDGMLWPDGRITVSPSNFAALITTGYDAVKSVSASSKVIVHVSNGHDNSLSRWVFDQLKTNNAKYDVIGLSLYPDAGNWSARNTACLANMNDMVSRYNKEVMMVEVGMSWDLALACQSFLADLIAKTKSLSGNKGLGVLYWEPQAYNNWQGYTKGAFDNSGKPTIALNAFN